MHSLEKAVATEWVGVILHFSNRLESRAGQAVSTAGEQGSTTHHSTLAWSIGGTMADSNMESKNKCWCALFSFFVLVIIGLGITIVVLVVMGGKNEVNIFLAPAPTTASITAPAQAQAAPAPNIIK